MNEFIWFIWGGLGAIFYALYAANDYKLRWFALWLGVNLFWAYVDFVSSFLYGAFILSSIKLIFSVEKKVSNKYFMR